VRLVVFHRDRNTSLSSLVQQDPHDNPAQPRVYQRRGSHMFLYWILPLSKQKNIGPLRRPSHSYVFRVGQGAWCREPLTKPCGTKPGMQGSLARRQSVMVRFCCLSIYVKGIIRASSRRSPRPGSYVKKKMKKRFGFFSLPHPRRWHQADNFQFVRGDKMMRNN
jgi:hypothetical protein